MCTYLNILLRPLSVNLNQTLSVNLNQEQTTVFAKVTFKKGVAAIALF